MVKTDYKRQYRILYKAGKVPSFVDVPSLQYLMMDGKGDPSTSKDFQEATQLLYGLSYTMKFLLKKDPVKPSDHAVGCLEGLWCADDMTAYSEGRRKEWIWTLMILQPKTVTRGLLSRALKEMEKKKKNIKLAGQVRLERLKEGKSIQLLFTGAYRDEGPVIKELHERMRAEGWTFGGRHHEIYMNDPRRVPASKLRTIIRQPIQRV